MPTAYHSGMVQKSHLDFKVMNYIHTSVFPEFSVTRTHPELLIIKRLLINIFLSFFCGK